MYTKQALILIVYVDAFTIEWVRARSCIPRISLGDSSFLSRYLISRVHDRWQRCIIREDIISYCCVLFICGTMKRPWKSLGSRRACSSKDRSTVKLTEDIKDTGKIGRRDVVKRYRKRRESKLLFLSPEKL